MEADPASLFNWLVSHGNNAIWLIALLLGGMGWVSKRLRDWQRQNPNAGGAVRGWIADAQTSARRVAEIEAAARRAAAENAAAGPAAQRAAAYAAAQHVAASYQAAPAYAPAEATKARQEARHPHQPRRTAAPPPQPLQVTALLDEPAGLEARRHALLEMLSSPASAQTAVVLAEILAPPVGLRREPGGLGLRSG